MFLGFNGVLVVHRYSWALMVLLGVTGVLDISQVIIGFACALQALQEFFRFHKSFLRFLQVF